MVLFVGNYVDEGVEVGGWRLVDLDNAAPRPQAIACGGRPVTEKRHVHAVRIDAALRRHRPVRILQERARPGYGVVDAATVERRSLDVDVQRPAIAPHGHRDRRLLHGFLERPERRHDLPVNGQYHVAVLQLLLRGRARDQPRNGQRAPVQRVVRFQPPQPGLVHAHVAGREQRRVHELRLQ